MCALAQAGQIRDFPHELAHCLTRYLKTNERKEEWFQLGSQFAITAHHRGKWQWQGSVAEVASHASCGIHGQEAAMNASSGFTPFYATQGMVPPTEGVSLIETTHIHTGLPRGPLLFKWLDMNNWMLRLPVKGTERGAHKQTLPDAMAHHTRGTKPHSGKRMVPFSKGMESVRKTERWSFDSSSPTQSQFWSLISEQNY